MLPAGTQTLTAEFTPEDGYAYSTAQATVSLSVSKATPEIAWPSPGAIAIGILLGDRQLCASASVPGRFDYSPPPGASLAAGVHTLSVEFTASDAENYTPVAASISLKVTKGMPTFEWPVPKPIQFGTPLTRSSSVPRRSVEGKFEYHPASGVVLPVGMHALSATFSPADSANYSAAQATLSLPVEKAMPSIEWPMLAPIIFGTPLSTAQLCATVWCPRNAITCRRPGRCLGLDPIHFPLPHSRPTAAATPRPALPCRCL